MKPDQQYDSLLYGNGITLAVLNKIKRLNSSEIESNLLSMSDFCHQLFMGPTHRKIYRDFLKTFNSCPSNYENVYDAGRQFIVDYMDEFTTLGFEATIGKHLLKNPDERFKGTMPFWYAFPNYWYNKLHNEVLQHEQVKDIIYDAANKIKSFGFKNIFTLNFDLLLDDLIFPQHLHGKFILPYTSFANLIVFHSSDKESYLHRYLLEAEGLRKLDALGKVAPHATKEYNLNFFRNNNIYIGNLLIYGVAFRPSETMTKEFLREYPEHEKTQLIHLTDGHIICRLVNMLDRGTLNRIDLAYFSESDKKHFQRLLSFSKLKGITKLIHTSEIELI